MNSVLLFLILFIFVCLLLLGLIDFAYYFGNFLVVEDPIRKADLIHVISGPDYRTEYAIDLYKKGYAEKLLFTGGWCESANEISAIRSERLALIAGVPSEKIIVDVTPILCTYEEAERLKELVNRKDNIIRSVIIVSDPFHMRRVRWTYRRHLKHQVILIMAPVPFELTPMNANWWKDAKSRYMVCDEYLKLVYYVLRYQLTRGRLQLWLASLDHD